MDGSSTVWQEKNLTIWVLDPWGEPLVYAFDVTPGYGRVYCDGLSGRTEGVRYRSSKTNLVKGERVEKTSEAWHGSTSGGCLYMVHCELEQTDCQGVVWGFTEREVTCEACGAVWRLEPREGNKHDSR
jgi:hypothetical protein